MINSIIDGAALYIKQILSNGGFKVTELKNGIYKQLLTAFQNMPNHDVVMIPELINLARGIKGQLSLDDTNNPSYGLKKQAVKIKNLSTGGYHNGYKILLFLWCTKYWRIPIGFALYHKESKSINELARKGLNLLRRTYKLRPETVLADAAFFTDATAKLLTDYGWPFVMRFNKARTLSGTPIRKSIPRGYGEETGRISNGTKLKVIRRKSRFFACNRMMWDVKKILKMYTLRWKIEEFFRVLKSCIGLDRCQQHTMDAQAIYIFMCLVLTACAERLKTGSVYEYLRQNFSGELDVEKLLKQGLAPVC